jgi:uncharacterized membrane protein HdeD (DUF308 family)
MSGAGPFDAGYLAPGGRAAVLRRNWWLVLIRGIVALLFGLVAIALPGPTIASLVLLFGIYMAVDGVFAIAAGVRAATRHERWGEWILEGIVDLIAAAIAFVFPLATVLGTVIFAGAWAVISGIALLAAAFRGGGTAGRGLMGLGGIVSILWGVLLFVFPIAGAVVLTYWLGIYALFFGGALVALALRLRQGIVR